MRSQLYCEGSIVSNNSTIGSRILVGTLLASLSAYCGIASSAGSSTAATLTAIYDTAAACAAEPMRGTVYYYCDCGTGADANCVPGDDANTGTDPAAPRRTITDAVTRFRSLTGTNTIAFCKGGAFDSSPKYWHSLNNSSCAAGRTCNDLREYSPTTFVSSAKPIINNIQANVTTFSVTGNYGGIRILNLALKGDSGAIGNRNDGFFFYAGAHDVTMCNLDMDGFDIAVNHNSGNKTTAPTTPNIKLTGSHITNSRTMGYLGGGNNAEVSHNYWDGNGGSNMFDHTIYVGSGELTTLNMKVIGNYIHGQHGPTCKGVVIVGHGEFDYLTVSDNYVEIDAAAGSGGCYGIGFGSGGYKTPAFFRHATFSGNTLKNTGNAALVIASCPDCVIENNLIIQDWDYTYPTTGILVAAETARVSPADDVSDRNIVRNNTVWYGPRHVHGALGISIRNEGTGHIVANNSVHYSSTSTVNTWGGVNCFAYPLALSSYAFIDNNHCFSNATYKWEKTQGSLAAWRTYSATYGFDTESITADPKFEAAGTKFTPAAGSPLIGAGSATYGSTADITGKVRPSPPAIGAFEPATSVSNVPPTVSLTSPANGASFIAVPGTVALSATAADSDGTVTRVDFYRGTKQIGSDASAPYSYFDRQLAVGSYTYTAVAYDNAGASTASVAATVTVKVNVPPTVRLTSPANGATFTAPATVTLAAAAGDSDGTIARVDFYRGSTLIFSSNAAPYAYTDTSLAGGTYSYKAVAYDNTGAATASAAAAVSVASGGGVTVNVAAQAGGGVASASSSYSSNYSTAGAINGDRMGRNWGRGGGWNDATAGRYPDWLQVNFGTTHAIGEIDIFTLQDNYTSPSEPTQSMTFTKYGITSFVVQYWNGSGWAAIPGGVVTGNNLVWRKFTFAPITTDRIRVLVNAGLYTYSRIVEIEAWTAGGAGTVSLAPVSGATPTAAAVTVTAGGGTSVSVAAEAGGGVTSALSFDNSNN